MSISSIQFNKNDRPDFYPELKRRVNQHFKDEGVSKHGNASMIFKSIVMLSLYFVPFGILLSGIVSSTWLILLLWITMGIGAAGIGFSIMHDANHGAYSSNSKLNKFMGFTLAYLGGYQVNWKIQHNVLHHTFTNIDGLDEDIEKKGLIRFSPGQEKKKRFRFQILYAPFLYAVLTLYWVTIKDFDQLIGYNKRGLLKGQNVSFSKALFHVIVTKVVYYAVIIALPILVTDIPWGIIVGGFLLMHAVSGLILAIVFQSAHVLAETEFFSEDKDQMENNWAVHQMKTTSNFAIGNGPLTWFLGGLNHQVEHHLFPTICHIHYPALSKIVKQTAKEYDVPYLEHKTFIGAIASHVSFLNALGVGRK